MAYKTGIQIENPMYNFTLCFQSAFHIIGSEDECVELSGTSEVQEWCILRMLNGNATLETADGGQISLAANDFCIMPSAQYKRISASSRKIEFYFFMFRTEKSNTPYPDFLYSIPILDKEKEISERLSNKTDEDAFYQPIYCSSLFCLLYTMWMRFLRKEYNKHFLFINKSQTMINRDIQPLVGNLALENNMSPQNYRLTFKKYFNNTPKKYMKQKRIEIAKQMLTTTLMQIKEIAECLGYDNQFYFSNDFKKSVGISPSQYRNVYLQRVQK